MDIGFAGTPEFAATILDALCTSRHDVRLVVTQPGRRAGRGHKIVSSPVETLARARGISVHTPTRLRDFSPVIEPLDVLVVAAYGMMLPGAVLNAPRLGCLNVHASLLPRWRGAAPIEYALLEGDDHTGVSIVQMSAKLDAGPVYHTASLPLTKQSTTASVTRELAQLGATALLETLDRATEDDFGPANRQDEAHVTFAPKIPDHAGRIDWTRPACALERQVRAFNGRGMAYALMPYKERDVRVRVHAATVVAIAGQLQSASAVPEPGTVIATHGAPIVACGNHGLELTKLQLNIGKGRPMAGRDVVNGFPELWRVGARFEQHHASADA